MPLQFNPCPTANNYCVMVKITQTETIELLPKVWLLFHGLSETTLSLQPSQFPIRELCDISLPYVTCKQCFKLQTLMRWKIEATVIVTEICNKTELEFTDRRKIQRKQQFT